MLLTVWLLQRVGKQITTVRNDNVSSGHMIRSLAIILVMAFLEELLFRQFLFLVLLRGGLHIWLAAGLSAIVFGLAHYNTWDRNALGLFNAALVGFVLAWELLRPHGLAWVTGIHFGWNFMQWNVFGYPLYSLGDQKFFVALWQTDPRSEGTRWLHGGSYGAEASVWTTALWFTWFGLRVAMGAYFVF